jgi:pimeloyl-ACP methyl ester carboxylesterase
MYWTAETYLKPWLQGLASRFQTVVFDGRGQGLSTRGLLETQTIVSLQRDLDAVVTKLDIQRFVLMAQTHATHLAVHYAIEHPERVAHLCWSPVARS